MKPSVNVDSVKIIVPSKVVFSYTNPEKIKVKKCDETTRQNITSNASTAVIILEWTPHTCQKDHNEKFTDGHCPPTKRRRLTGQFMKVQQTGELKFLSSSSGSSLTKAELIKTNRAAFEKAEQPQPLLGENKRICKCITAPYANHWQ